MMADRQWPDPQGWEALTQQEAEQDARERAYVGRELWAWLRDATRERDEARDELAVAVRERDQARDALRDADRILEWWHGTFEPHTRRAFDYEACEPCRTIREQVRAALAGGQT